MFVVLWFPSCLVSEWFGKTFNLWRAIPREPRMGNALSRSLMNRYSLQERKEKDEKQDFPEMRECNHQALVNYIIISSRILQVFVG